MTERLIIGQHLLQQVLEHCLEEKPYEACGIMTGKAGRVHRAYATDNAKRSPVFYEVDAEQASRVLQGIADLGEELVAIYHSHPTAAAVPSQNDLNQAVHYPEVLRLIIAVSGPTDLRAYRIQRGKAQDVMIAICADAGGTFHDLRRAAEHQE